MCRRLSGRGLVGHCYNERKGLSVHNVHINPQFNEFYHHLCKPDLGFTVETNTTIMPFQTYRNHRIYVMDLVLTLIQNYRTKPSIKF